MVTLSFRGIQFQIALADESLFRGRDRCKARLDPDTNTILVSPHTAKEERLSLIANAMTRVIFPCPELELLNSRRLPTVDVG